MPRPAPCQQYCDSRLELAKSKKMASSSCKRPEMVVVAVGVMLMLSTAYMQRGESCEDVLDRNGENILYGSENTFTVWNTDVIGLGYLDFFFGLGYAGDVVHTDTGLTMGYVGNASLIFECQADGRMTLTPISATPSSQSIIRVRRNANDTFYQLAITDTPNTFVQVVIASQGAVACLPGYPGSRLQFERSSNSSTLAHDVLQEPTTPHSLRVTEFS